MEELERELEELKMGLRELEGGGEGIVEVRLAESEEGREKEAEDEVDCESETAEDVKLDGDREDGPRKAAEKEEPASGNRDTRGREQLRNDTGRDSGVVLDADHDLELDIFAEVKVGGNGKETINMDIQGPVLAEYFTEEPGEFDYDDKCGMRRLVRYWYAGSRSRFAVQRKFRNRVMRERQDRRENQAKRKFRMTL